MTEPPIIASTQDHLDLLDVQNNLAILKNGSAALILKTSAVNFNLLSEEEQDAIIYAYAALLNSLTFPIQILIRSQKKDVSNYVKYLEAQEEKILSPTKRDQLKNYTQFITQIVKERNVLDKNFYCIILFSHYELGLAPQSLIPLKKTAAPHFDKNYIVSKAITSLEPKRDHLIRQFSRIGLIARQLKDPEIIQLFYTIYNPDSTQEIKLVSGEQYTNPIIQGPPGMEKPLSPEPIKPSNT